MMRVEAWCRSRGGSTHGVADRGSGFAPRLPLLAPIGYPRLAIG
jgi:hypothetical protein